MQNRLAGQWTNGQAGDGIEIVHHPLPMKGSETGRKYLVMEKGGLGHE